MSSKPTGNKLNEILNKPDKAIDQAQDVLSRLFQQILADLAITPPRWAAMMAHWRAELSRLPGKTRKDVSIDRGNLNRNLMRSTMSWKVFMRGLTFLGVDRLRIEVHLTRGTKTTQHGVDVRVRSRNPLVDEPDDSND